MKGLMVQIGGGTALLLGGVFVGMQIGTKEVVVRTGVPGPSVARAHRTAEELRRADHQSKKVRHAPPAAVDGHAGLSAAGLRLEAVALADGWIGDLSQEEDRFRRMRGLEATREALTAGSKVEILAGLHAFLECLKIDFDKASFRGAVEPHLQAEDGWTRRNAWYALYHTGPREDDVAVVRQLAGDPDREVRQSASHLITMYEDGDLTGESGEVVLRMLSDEDRAMRREVLRGMWGARFSPDLEGRVIELSRSDDPEQRHDAIYFALSTQANKSAGSVLRLIELLGDPDWNNSGRAAWGLRHGVPAGAEPMVADAALGMMQEDPLGRSWKHGMELLKRYAGPDQLEAIETLANREGLPEPALQQLAEVELQALRDTPDAE